MARPQLEIFTADPPAPSDVAVVELSELVALREEAHAAGYAEGYAAAEGAIALRTAEAESAALGLLSGLDEAHGRLQDQLMAVQAQILTEVFQKVLPAMGREVLGAHLRETCGQLLRAPFEEAITLEVNPLAVASVTPWLAHSRVIRWQLEENPDLALAASRLHLPDGSYHLDLSRTVDEILAHLRDYFTQILESPHD